jgi:hypothetical protein
MTKHSMNINNSDIHLMFMFINCFVVIGDPREAYCLSQNISFDILRRDKNFKYNTIIYF